MAPGVTPDERWLRRALRLAERGRYTSAPNPRVGAVVVRDGEVLAEGFHRRPGEPHGEADALSRLPPGAARGATLFVNLEPCSHHGRTPPCVDAILAAGVARVVYCHHDPNQAAARGRERLRAAGVEVEHGLLAAEAIRLNLPFLCSHLLGRPAVTLKWAMSLDGRIATEEGESQWISSPRSRGFALALREEHDAVLVGSGTVLSDDPRLDRRRGLAPGPGLRVVLDRRLRVRSSARLFQVPGPVLVYTESPREDRELAAAGAEVVRLARVDPAAVLADLHRRAVGSVLVEGGGEMLGAFAGSRLFDRVVVCCAPLLIGGRRAASPLEGEPLGRLAEVPRLESVRSYRRGPDVWIEGLRSGCSQVLSASVVG
jgi:diaminohydroxyphosphoribosylaminopyrimidine deaminase/5-amino-6-(5-phosphoribosylamino)uracil reductase